MKKVGVFDSGIGGLSVAKAIEKALPNYEVIYRNDKAHVPYGNKTPEEVFGYVVPILQDLAAQGCEAIVIACNTVTTEHIIALRKILPVPLVGIEPMVRPAAKLTKSKVIAVCATPGTLGTKRYAWLKETYASGIKVVEPDCSDWAQMIEHNKINEAQIERQINDLCGQGVDVIVLGCTHYHWIEDVIQKIAGGRAEVIQPEQPVIKQLKLVLGDRIKIVGEGTSEA